MEELIGEIILHLQPDQLAPTLLVSRLPDMQYICHHLLHRRGPSNRPPPVLGFVVQNTGNNI